MDSARRHVPRLLLPLAVALLLVWSIPGHGISVIWIEVDLANIRNGPGLSFDVVGTVEWGTSVGLLSGQDDWLEVKYTVTGKTGWIMESLTTSLPPSESGSGTCSACDFTYTRSGNSYVVELEPPLPVEVRGVSGEMPAIVESIYGPGTLLESWPKLVPDTEARLFRLEGKDDYYYVWVSVDEDGLAEGLRIWRGRPPAAG